MRSNCPGILDLGGAMVLAEFVDQARKITTAKPAGNAKAEQVKPSDEIPDDGLGVSPSRCDLLAFTRDAQVHPFVGSMVRGGIEIDMPLPPVLHHGRQI